MPRCLCITKKETQCLNTGSIKPNQNPKFCWLHQKCQQRAKPSYLLTGIANDVIELTSHKHDPYDQFIEYVINHHNYFAKLVFDEGERDDTITPEMMNAIEYPPSTIMVDIPSSAPVKERSLWKFKTFETHTLNHQGGFTKGQLLYQLVQILPSDNRIWGPFIEFEGLRLQPNGHYGLAIIIDGKAM